MTLQDNFALIAVGGGVPDVEDAQSIVPNVQGVCEYKWLGTHCYAGEMKFNPGARAAVGFAEQRLVTGCARGCALKFCAVIRGLAAKPASSPCDARLSRLPIAKAPCAM
jgi:hypothetical protein